MKVFASTTFLGPGRTRIGDALVLLDGLDIDGVELGSTHVWESGLAAIVTQASRHSLIIHNYCPPARNDLVVNLASLDGDIRGASLAHALSCLDFACDVGAPLYTVHPGAVADATATTGKDSTGTYDFAFAASSPRTEALKRSIDALAVLCEEARRRGIVLAMETEGSRTKPDVLLFDRPDEVARLMEALPGLQFNVNLAHSMLAAAEHGYEFDVMLDVLAGRIVAAEISDHDGFRDRHQPLKPDSPVLDWVDRLPDVPLIMEFRDASTDDLVKSAEILGRKLKKIPS